MTRTGPWWVFKLVPVKDGSRTFTIRQNIGSGTRRGSVKHPRSTAKRMFSPRQNVLRLKIVGDALQLLLFPGSFQPVNSYLTFSKTCVITKTERPGKAELHQAGLHSDAPHPALDRSVHPFMPSTVLCTGKATYKKQNGTLQLTNSHITFTPDGKVAPSLKIPNTDHSCLCPHYSLSLQTVNSSVGSGPPS